MIVIFGIVCERYKKLLLIPFILLELILFFMIQYRSFGITSESCFASVAIAFLFSILFASRCADSYLTVCGMLFTVCADYFLVLDPKEPRLLAMIFFFAVQLCYFARLLISEEKRVRRLNIISRIILIFIIIGLAFLILGESTDTLAIISVAYFANLLLNIVFAFSAGRKYLIFAIGLLSFALCDIFVGLGVLANDYLGVERGTLLYSLTHTEINLIWLFYVPAQTLISISANNKN